MFLPDPDATHALGMKIGRLARPGLVIAMVGDLGMGKSALARGVARGLGLTERIPSPTFVIANSYLDGRLPFHHMDLYRLGAADELEQLGLDELVGEGVVVVEWAGRFPEILPDDHLQLTLSEVGDGRQIEASGGSASMAFWRQVCG